MQSDTLEVFTIISHLTGGSKHPKNFAWNNVWVNLPHMNCDSFFILVVTRCRYSSPCEHTQFSLVFLTNSTCFSVHFTHETPFSILASLAEICFCFDEQCCRCLFSYYMSSKRAKMMKNNCGQPTFMQSLHFPCYLVFYSIWHMLHYSRAVSLGKLSCHYVFYLPQSSYSFIPNIFFSFWMYWLKLYVICGHILCRVLNCRLDIFGVFVNAYDLQLVINYLFLSYWTVFRYSLHSVNREINCCCCCCRSLGFWHRVDLQVNADVSEKHAVSIFRGWSDKTGN
jgi:hypothetical protein